MSICDMRSHSQIRKPIVSQNTIFIEKGGFIEVFVMTIVRLPIGGVYYLLLFSVHRMDLSMNDNLVIGCLVGTNYDYVRLCSLVHVFSVFGVVGLRVVGLMLVTFVGTVVGTVVGAISLLVLALGAFIARLVPTIVSLMTVLTALVALGLVEIAAFAGLVSVSPTVIAMVTQVSVAAIGGPGVAVRVIVARAVLLLYVGRLL